MKTAIIFETPFWEIFLSDDQLYLGRCVLVLKRKCDDLAKLTAEEEKDFFSLVKRLEALLRMTFGAKMFNWGCLMNDAYQEEPPDPQVHWHFRPRYDKKVEFAGEVFEDPNFGRHYLRTPEDKRKVSPEVAANIIAELRKNL